jgi:hypothetical protein
VTRIALIALATVFLMPQQAATQNNSSREIVGVARGQTGGVMVGAQVIL